jgi:regulator of ribonuclease activity A
VSVADPVFTDFGGMRAFGGRVATVRVLEDNVLVRSALEEPGEGRVLVIDGGGSTRCALLGDVLATIAVDNGWSGIIVNGCIRDSDALSKIAIGIKALGTNPRKSDKRGEGERDVPVTFAGVTFESGCFAYADPAGIVVSPRSLTKQGADTA